MAELFGQDFLQLLLVQKQSILVSKSETPLSDCSIRYIFTSLCKTALKNDSPGKDSQEILLVLVHEYFYYSSSSIGSRGFETEKLARNVDSYILQSLS